MGVVKGVYEVVVFLVAGRLRVDGVLYDVSGFEFQDYFGRSVQL